MLTSMTVVGHRWLKRCAMALGVLAILLVALHLWVPKPLFDAPTSTVVSDCRGSLLGSRIAADQQWRFPLTDSVSRKFEHCIVEYEDHRFRYHLGIDLIAVCRALFDNLQSGKVKQGGSTLTMQVARMARGNQSRTIGQKIIEALWAIDIELSYSKEEILRMYASNAPFGGNTVGIDAAAWRYFGRDAHNLSWAENATLAVLPNSPALIHLSRNRKALQQKRDALLRKLWEEQIISAEEYDLALQEPLPDAPLPIPNLAPHLLARIASNHEGESVNSTVDGRLQQLVQDIADRYSNTYKANYISDIAILVLDVETGNPLVYVGNSTPRTATSDVDNIVSERSPGSLLKPMLYASMMTDGAATPDMIFADTPLNLNGFTPMNYSKSFSGVVKASEAVTRSLNVPLVRMVSKYGVGRFMSVLKTLGMTTLHYDEDHYGASIILGGAEARLDELTRIYAKLARQLNNVRNSGMGDEEFRLSPAAIWYAFEAMSALSRPEEEADWNNFRSMKRVAWKTGTSWGSRDAWAIGVTPKYAVGVWVGNSSGEGRSGLTGVGYAAPVMFDVYTLLDDSGWFTEPFADMTEARVCLHSGHIASSVCGDTEVRLLPKGSMGTAVCPYCRLVHLSADGAWQVNSSGESVNRIRTESRFVLPPAQEYYFAGHSATYQPLPPLRPDCRSSERDFFSIISPEPNSSVVLPRNFGGKSEQLVLRVACRDAGATLFWHLDDQYLGQTSEKHEMTVVPAIGQHWLTVLDEHGNKKTIGFTVK